MRTLLVARHAHSPGPPPGQNDYDRPLSARGVAEATAMGLRLAREGLALEHTVCSAAPRALRTARLISEGLGLGMDAVDARDVLYGAGVSRLVTAVEELNDGHRSVLLVAHNPGITELANWLSGEWHSGLPPCGVVRFELDVDRWVDAARGVGAGPRYFLPDED